MTPFALDKSSIMERLGDDLEIYQMMVDLFLQDVDQNCTQLQAAQQSGDLASLQREAHTVKSLLATFSDDAGAAFAQQIELQAKAGDLQDAAGRVEQLCQRVFEVAGVLRSEAGA